MLNYCLFRTRSLPDDPSNILLWSFDDPSSILRENTEEHRRMVE